MRRKRSSLNLMCEKLQRTIFFASRFRFNSFLQRWKTLVKSHNLIYFNFYHMLRCIEIIIAMSFAIECNTTHFDISIIKTWFYSHLNNIRKTFQFNNFINNEWILFIFESLKCVWTTLQFELFSFLSYVTMQCKCHCNNFWRDFDCTKNLFFFWKFEFMIDRYIREVIFCSWILSSSQIFYFFQFFMFS